MKKNLGTLDRTIRIVVALAVGVLLLTGTLSGVTGIVLGVVAVVFLLTGAVSFCPLYAMFKWSTSKTTTTKP